MSFPRYPKYKASGVEWLGEVPAHWDVKPVKNLASIIYGYPFDSELFDTSEGSPLVRIRDLNKYEAETYYKGEFVESAAITSEDVLIGMDGDFNVGRWLGKGRALLNQRMCCVRGKNRLLTRLLEHALPIPLRAINELTYATTVKHLAASQVEKTLVAIPPDTSEQTLLAGFLDRETAKIDGLVAEQQRLMELLKEKRQAVISHAVTRGLNPKAPLKPSGIKWLGDIPEHWRISQSRRMFSVRSEPALETDRMLTASQKYGVLYQSDFVEREGRRVVEVIMGIESLKHVEPDDFIISMRSFQGGLEWCRLRGSTSFHYVMITPIKWVHPPFFAHLFKSAAYIQALRATTDLIRDGQELRFSNFAQVDLPVVPIEEQAKITAYLNTETTKFDTLTAEAQRAIDLLQERRTALISAAVTGQIDVRGVVAREESLRAVAEEPAPYRA